MSVIECRYCANKTKLYLRINYIQDLSEIEKAYFGNEQLIFYAEKNWKIYECPVYKEITILCSYRGEDTKISSHEYDIEIECIYPIENKYIKNPNEDMPEKVKSLYNEANIVYVIRSIIERIADITRIKCRRG